MKVDLPDGAWAELLSRDEITERVFRPISYAKNRTIAVSSRLLQAGYKPPEQWADDLTEAQTEQLLLKNLELASGLSDQDQEQMREYQARLILGLTKSWSYDLPIDEDSVLGLTTDIFDALSGFCGEEFDKTSVDTGPDPNP
jgi:hypothetical protein